MRTTEVGLWLEQINPFIGRTAELARLDDLVSKPGQWVTCYGAAGVGKTRLCAHWLATREQATLICELEHVQTAQGIWAQLAEALLLRQDAALETPANPRILAALKQLAPHVILVDNFEHLVAHGLVLRQWLAAAPQHTVLVCSRRRLGLRGERGYELLGLPVEAGTELFNSRAQELLGTAFTTDPAVPRIAERLDGNPLAIELAASQVVLHPPARILASLDDELLDMTTAWADVPARQRSLRHAMGSTWHVLTPEAQQVWCWAAWFEGAFALTDLPVALQGSAALLQLRTHSLLRPLTGVGGVSLFAFFRVARQFGRDQSAGRPEGITKAVLKGAETALTCALKTQAEADRAAFSSRIPDLEIGALSTDGLGVKAAILLQRARRQLAVLGRDDATALARLRRIWQGAENAVDRVAAQVELVWGDLARGVLDAPHVNALIAEAESLEQPMLCGDLALACAHHLDRGMHIEQARQHCVRATEYFTQADQPTWVLTALIEELRHAMHLTLGGAPTPDNLNARFAWAGRLHAQIGTATHFEQLEQLRALDAYRRGDLSTARQKTAEGLARTAQHATSAVRVQWLQYLHSGMTRSGLHAEAVALGSGMIEKAQRCGTLVEVIAQEQAFALAALDRVAEAVQLLDQTCDASTLGALTLGPIELVRALAELKAGRLDAAMQHCSKAIELVRPTDAWNRLTFGLSLMGYLHRRQGQAAAARARFDEARTLLRRFDPNETSHRAIGVECFESGGDPAQLAALEPQTRHGMLARIAWITMTREHPPTEATAVDLLADATGAWFERSKGDRVDLVGRAALRRLFTELLRRHAAGDHAGLGMYALIEIGWPDEAASAQGGAGRVRAAMHTLRSLGLRGILINRSGYLFDPKAAIKLVNA